MEFWGVVDSSIATYPPAATSCAIDGDPVYYRVVLPDSLPANEAFPGLFVYSSSARIEVGSGTYSASSIYTGFLNYTNPAIGTYNGVCLEDYYSGDLEYGQLGFYNLVGAQTTDPTGVLLSSGLIPAPGADATAGYNIGILHFRDSQTPQAHTFWRVTAYAVTLVPPPEPPPDPEPPPGMDANESKILALAVMQGHLTIKECAQKIHVSKATARRCLQKLASEGILQRRGKSAQSPYWLTARQ